LFRLNGWVRPDSRRAGCRKGQGASVGGRAGPKAGLADGPTDDHRAARSP